MLTPLAEGSGWNSDSNLNLGKFWRWAFWLNCWGWFTHTWHRGLYYLLWLELVDVVTKWRPRVFYFLNLRWVLTYLEEYRGSCSDRDEGKSSSYRGSVLSSSRRRTCMSWAYSTFCYINCRLKNVEKLLKISPMNRRQLQ